MQHRPQQSGPVVAGPALPPVAPVPGQVTPLPRGIAAPLRRTPPLHVPVVRGPDTTGVVPLGFTVPLRRLRPVAGTTGCPGSGGFALASSGSCAVPRIPIEKPRRSTVGLPAPARRVPDRALRLADQLRRYAPWLLAAATAGALSNDRELLRRTSAPAGYAERIASYIERATSELEAVWSEAQLANELQNLRRYAQDAITHLRQARQTLLRSISADPDALKLSQLTAPAAVVALHNRLDAGHASPGSTPAYLAALLASVESYAMELASTASSYLQGTD